jgi:parallel beta-helix repeat protein
MKIAGGKSDIKVDGNHFHHNYGNAIWFDVGVHDVVVSNNLIHHNARRGIFFELSKRADIFGNTLYENGWASPDGVNGAGLIDGEPIRLQAGDIIVGLEGWKVVTSIHLVDDALVEFGVVHHHWSMHVQDSADQWIDFRPGRCVG